MRGRCFRGHLPAPVVPGSGEVVPVGAVIKVGGFSDGPLVVSPIRGPIEGVMQDEVACFGVDADEVSVHECVEVGAKQNAISNIVVCGSPVRKDVRSFEGRFNVVFGYGAAETVGAKNVGAKLSLPLPSNNVCANAFSLIGNVVGVES